MQVKYLDTRSPKCHINTSLALPQYQQTIQPKVSQLQ